MDISPRDSSNITLKTWIKLQAFPMVANDGCQIAD